MVGLGPPRLDDHFRRARPHSVGPQMITEAHYRRFTEEQWKGRKVRSLRDMRNGYAELPAGTIFTITGKYKGFSLVSDPCATCGVKIHIGRVSGASLELVS